MSASEIANSVPQSGAHRMAEGELVALRQRRDDLRLEMAKVLAARTEAGGTVSDAAIQRIATREAALEDEIRSCRQKVAPLRAADARRVAEAIAPTRAADAQRALDLIAELEAVMASVNKAQAAIRERRGEADSVPADFSAFKRPLAVFVK